MKLFITMPWRERLGGAETMLWNFLSNIDTKRATATVAFLEAGPLEREVAGLPGVDTLVVPRDRLRHVHKTLRSAHRLADHMRHCDPDVILNWAPTAQVYGAWAAQMARMSDRVVWWQHTITTGQMLDRAATLLPARAVGCSSSVAAAHQRGLRPRRDVFVVHPGSQAHIAEPASREAMGIPSGRLVFGIVGRLQPWKGQHRLLRAVAALRDHGHDVHALVVGGDAYGLSPEYAVALDRLIHELSLHDRVTLTGQVRDPLPYIGAMDVLVNASVAEPFGIVLIEGMSQGIPVVAVGDGGAGDIVEHGRTGLLIDRADETLLAHALGRLTRDEEWRLELGRAGRQRFLEAFTAQAMSERLQTQLEALCGGPSHLVSRPGAWSVA